MEVREAIKIRRAYRSLEPVAIGEEVIEELVEAIRLTPSCFNNQPWRFVFITEETVLKEIFSTLSQGNEWATKASLIVAVFSEKKLDCEIKGREYYLFDTGMATAFLILQATELGLVAHPIAGYDEEKVKEILRIPKEMVVITLVIIGKHSEKIGELLTEKQKEIENKRPERLPREKFIYFNRFR